MNTWGFLRSIRSIYLNSEHRDDESLSLREFKPNIDKRIGSYVESRIIELYKFTDNTRIRSAIDHIHDLTQNGKRVRPYIAYLAYRLAGGTGDIYDALVGVELFHVFAMIHDDIIDRSDERHGKSTLHHHYRSLIGENKHGDHIASAQAILIGDLVFSWSHDALLSHTTLNTVHEVRKVFNRMIDEVVVGQMIDVDLMGRDKTTNAELEQKNLLKTARYTFVNPLKIGVALAGKAGAFDDFFEAWGQAIGSAYQIQDDLLDITGDTRVTGKAILKDFEDGQHTFVTQHILSNGSEDDKRVLSSFWKCPLSVDDKKNLVLFLEKTHALDRGRELVNILISKAEKALSDHKLPDPYKTAFEKIVIDLKQRNS